MNPPATAAGMSPPSRAGLDKDNPWPGLESYAEGDERFFRGRGDEIAELLRLVRREPLTVLFGISGLGKTSLVNAGLFPELRKLDFIPVSVRVDFTGEGGKAPAAQLLSALLAKCNHVDRSPDDAESLWEYFHHKDTVFWNHRNRPATPVIVLDQFEELFTEGLDHPDEARRESARRFLVELGDLIENRVPLQVKARLEQPGATARQQGPDLAAGRTMGVASEVRTPDSAAKSLNFGKADFKICLSFREDYLPHFERLKAQIPSLTHNRMRLEAMSGTQAIEVVEGSHATDAGVSKENARLLDEGVGGGHPRRAPPTTADGTPPLPLDDPLLQVEPALLSMICRELNLARQRAGRERITLADTKSGADQEILSRFYVDKMKGRDRRLRAFIEDQLITKDGRHRNSVPFDDALTEGIGQRDLDELVQGRLLRVDSRLGADKKRLELTHDVLTKVVRTSRDERKLREGRRRVLVAAAGLAIGFLAVAGGAWYVLGLKDKVTEGEVALETQMVNAAKQQAQAQRELDQQKAAADLLTAETNRLNELAIDLQANAKSLQEAATLERQRAGKLLAQAEAMRLVTLASRKQDTHDLALLLNVEAQRRSPDLIDARASLLAQLVARPHLTSVVHGGEALYALRVEPDRQDRPGRYIASAGEDGKVRLWDPKTRALTRTLTGHEDKILALALSPDGSILASASADLKVMLWETATGRRIKTLGDHRGAVVGVAFSPDGRSLASASQDGRVRVWDIETRVLRASLEAPGGAAVQSVSYSPDGKTLAAAGDKSVVAWDVARLADPADAQRGRRVIANHLDTVRALAFSPDSKTVATAGDDLELRLWDTGSGQLRAPALKGHAKPVRSLAFSANGDRLASSGEDGTVKLWAVAGDDKPPPLTLEGHRNAVWAVAFGANADRLASVGDDGKLILWDVAAHLATRTFQKHPGWVRQLSFDRAGKHLAAAGADEGVLFWDVKSGERMPQPGKSGLKNDIRSVAFRPDGQQLLAGGDDRRVVVWDFGSRMQAVKGPEAVAGQVLALAYSHDGKLAAAAGRQGTNGRVTVTLWDALTWRRTGALDVPAVVWDMAFSPDGRWLALAQEDGSITLWELNTQKRAAQLSGHGRAVRAVAFSPKGGAMGETMLASASEDGTVILWQVDPAKRLATLSGHDGAHVLAIAFSADGKMLASAGRDKKLVLWDVEAGKSLLSLAGQSEEISAVAVGSATAPQGAWIASASRDKSLVLYDWDARSLAAKACEVANRNLSCSEWSQYMGRQPRRKTCDALPLSPCSK